MSIEHLFSQLAISGASMVSKAAFSYATSLAVKRISTLITDSTVQSNEHHPEIIRLHEKLSRQFAMIMPSIDKVEFMAAQGNTSLLPLLDMIDQLKSSVQSLMHQIEQNEHAQLVNVMQDTLDSIKDLLPFLQLGLQQFNTHGTMYGSTSRLLQAAHDLSTQDHHIGPCFLLTVYSLFHGSVRPKSFSDFTWKEDLPKAKVQLHRTAPFVYSLSIQQDLQDGLYHEDEEKGVERRIPLTDIQKSFYATSGDLLNIPNSASAVLVLKIGQKTIHRKEGTPVKQDKVEWMALGLYAPVEESGSESSSDEGSEIETVEHPNDPGLLSRLDYILRLASVEMFKQQPFHQVSDDVFDLFLQQTKQEVLPHSTPSNSVVKMSPLLTKPRKLSFQE